MPVMYLAPYKGASSDANSDPFFNQVKTLFLAQRGLVDLAGNSVFDTKTAPLTSTYVKYGSQSVEFDGTNAKRLESSTGTGGQLTDTGWTIEAWVYPTGTADKAICSNQSGANSGAFLFYIAGASNKIVFFTNIQRAISTATVTPNAWNHVAITKNGATSATLWINGQPEVLSGNFVGNYSAAVGLAIGSRLGGTSMFRGGIDSVRITQAIRYTQAFTPTQFSDH